MSDKDSNHRIKKENDYLDSLPTLADILQHEKNERDTGVLSEDDWKEPNGECEACKA